MYIKRKIDAFLKQWKSESDHLPLIIKGARQTGKTESIRQFASSHYSSVIEINFVTSPMFKTITGDGYSAEAITRRISLLNPEFRFVPGDTLLFFDELQAFPDIATSLKFFKEDGRYDVICSGSLLGISYHEIESISVGNKTDYVMHSLDFEEYLWALGYQPEQIDALLQHMIRLKGLSETEMTVFSNHFFDYCILGGMPAVIKNYLGTHLFTDSLQIQKQILLDYQEDARKYAAGLDQAKIIQVMNSIPSQLARENKRFMFSKVSHGGRFSTYAGCIQWLQDAGIVSPCWCLGSLDLPLKGNIDPTKFKVYLQDTGLLIAQLDEEAQADLRTNRNLGVYSGALYENMTAEALIKQGYDLSYYRRDTSPLELDFLIRIGNDLVPLEVKAVSGKAKRLRTVIDSPDYEAIHYGIKFYSGNISRQNDIISFPHFTAFLLHRYADAVRRF
jgi:predicted AAA+ superfamily ATPase